ncbi:MAG: hypothetical protein P4L33_02510 [Capsulimonadaceae bacterium]|nr:hypothetical protein [Capsulimonadaceae bacterium]
MNSRLFPLIAAALLFACLPAATGHSKPLKPLQESGGGTITYTVTPNDLITEIWTVKADGSGRRRVRTLIGGTVDGGPWLPAERWIAFEHSSPLWWTPDIKSRSADTTAGHPMLGNEILLLDTLTGTLARSGLSDWFDPLYVTLSPKGTLMAFNGAYYPNGRLGDYWKRGEGGIWVYDPKKGKATKLLSGWIKTAPSWSPDGESIAISTTGGYTNDHHLVIVSIGTGRVRDLGINGAGACFSPNGRKIAYCGDFKKEGSWYAGVPVSGSIFSLDLSSGSKPVRLSPESQGATRPQWSPDGSRILYVASGKVVCVAQADGSGSRAVSRSDDDVAKASWDPAGKNLFVTTTGANDGKMHTLVAASDGSGVPAALDLSGQPGALSSEQTRQTDAASRAIKTAIFDYAMGQVHWYEGDLKAMRECCARSASIFGSLVPDDPLSGIGVDDAMRYRNIIKQASARDDAVLLKDACAERLDWLGWVIAQTAAAHRRFPPDLPTALKWAVEQRCGVDWLQGGDNAHIALLGGCPGDGTHGAAQYVYTGPADGSEPKVGDVIVKCPLHPQEGLVWGNDEHQTVHAALMQDGKRGATCETPPDRGVSYRFENVGDKPLTVVHNLIGDTYEIKGTAKVSPGGKTYENETVSLRNLDTLPDAKP